MVDAWAWPYYLLTENLLKLFADAQIFLVLVVGLILRFDDALLAAEQTSRRFYHNILLITVASVAIPLGFTALWKDDVQKAESLLLKMAKVDVNDSSKTAAVQRKKLQSLKRGEVSLDV